MGLKACMVAVLVGLIRGSAASEDETPVAKASVPASSAPIADGPNAGRGARVEDTSVLTSGSRYDLTDAALPADATAAGRRLQTCNLGETLLDAVRPVPGVPKTTYKCVKEVPGAPKYCGAMKAVAIKGKPLKFPIPHGPGCAFPSSTSEWVKLNLLPWSDRTKITEETWDGTAYDDVVPERGPRLSQNCEDLKNSALELHDGLASFAKDDFSPLGATGNAMTGVLAGILATNALEKSLDALFKGMDGAVTVLNPLINAIPFKPVKIPLKVVMDQAEALKVGVKEARDLLKTFNENKAVEKVRKYACKGQDLTKTLAFGLVKLSGAYDLNIKHYLQKNDPDICDEWYLSHVNSLGVGVMTADFEGLDLGFASNSDKVEFFNFVTALSENCALKSAVDFFQDLEDALQPVKDALYAEILDAGFSLADILEGLGDAVDDAIEFAVDAAVAIPELICDCEIDPLRELSDLVGELLPDLDFPDLDFPDFPDFDVDLPALPEIDPADFFPAPPDGLTSAPTPVELNINAVDTAGCQKLSEDCPAVCPYTRSCPSPRDLSGALLRMGDFVWIHGPAGGNLFGYDGTFRSRNLNCSSDDLSVGDYCIADGVCALPEDGKLCFRDLPDVTEVCPDSGGPLTILDPFAGQPCPGLCDCPLVTGQVSLFQIIDSTTCEECTTSDDCDGECDLSRGPGRKLRFGAGAVGCCA
mmetsp:Transcript_7099/g.20903  ORF Transcript_7099/g.20903 Transcript_7099/m.20903 type:complete len:701 (+) Transcript_7099:215-2317(+)